VQHARKVETKRGRCSGCHQEHYIMFCDGYKAKTAAERKQHVEAANLCLNCLGKHKASECSSKKACSACGERYHTTLHDACKELAVAKTTHQRTPRVIRRRLPSPFYSRQHVFASRIDTEFRTSPVPWWTRAPSPRWSPKLWCNACD